MSSDRTLRSYNLTAVIREKRSLRTNMAKLGSELGILGLHAAVYLTATLLLQKRKDIFK